MADAPIGISFMPTQDAAAQGPRQAQIEGQGGSDLAQAFKILSLHLPRVLGASAITSKRLALSPGSAGVSSSGGASVNPLSAAFEALLKSLGGGSEFGSMSSIVGGGPAATDSAAGNQWDSTRDAPAPKVSFNTDRNSWDQSASAPSSTSQPDYSNQDTQYI